MANFEEDLLNARNFEKEIKNSQLFNDMQVYFV